MAQSLAKLALLRFHTENPLAKWDDQLSGENTTEFMMAMKYFYATADITLERYSIFHHPSTRYYLIGLSDASDKLYAVQIFLVSSLLIDNVYHAKKALLFMRSYVTRSELSSIPHKELLGFVKLTQKLVQFKVHLSTLGIDISHVIMGSDSATVIHQVRTRPDFLAKKIQGLVSKVILLFMGHDLCLYRNIYFFKQGSAGFTVDILTKALGAKATASEAHMRNIQKTLLGAPWLTQHVNTWTFLTRYTHLPKITQRWMLEDLQASPQFLKQTMESLHFRHSDATENIFSDFPLNNRGCTSLASSKRALGCTTKPIVDGTDFCNLLERKFSRTVDAPGSPIRIISLAFYWIQKVRAIISLPQVQRDILKNERTDDL